MGQAVGGPVLLFSLPLLFFASQRHEEHCPAFLNRIKKKLAAQQQGGEKMSWYQNTAHFTTSGFQNACRKKMLLPVTITNLDSPEAEEKLLKALINLPGIDDVKVNLAEKQLFITFDPQLLRTETIAYTLSNLGYHYVQRS